MWQPNKSTLLSVLISIQAMILGAPAPYLNEPGHEIYDPRDAASIAYTNRVQSKVVRYAMIPFLEKLLYPTGDVCLWEDVSRTHWIQNGREVVETVRRWTKDNQELMQLYGKKQLNKKLEDLMNLFDKL
jgi:hypothetical protein